MAPAHVPLEDFVPYDRSLQWSIQHAYFAARGGTAFRRDEVPSYATSNRKIAEEHLVLVRSVVRELERAGTLGKRDPVRVLEIGAGSGGFCASFFGALDALPPRERALAGRVRYVLSDYAETNVRDAARSARIAPLVGAGRVAPALFDATRPGSLRRLDGAAPERAAILFANYVCCTTPAKILRKRGAIWEEKHVRLLLRVPEGSRTPSPQEARAAVLARAAAPRLLQKDLDVQVAWRPVDLDRLFPDPIHGATIREASADVDVLAFAYPYFFLDMLRGIAPLVLPGGVFVLSDYGYVRPRELWGATDLEPSRYGNSTSHEVSFFLLDAFCRRAGLEVVRTLDPGRALQIAALRFGGPPSSALGAGFAEAYTERRDSEILLAMWAAVQALTERGENREAFCLLRECARADPDWIEANYRLGDLAIDLDSLEFALERLLHGKAQAGSEAWDFDFALGRAYSRLGRHDEAIAAYERSLKREEHPAAHVNIGVALEERGDPVGAVRSYRRALELDPAFAAARERLESIARGEGIGRRNGMVRSKAASARATPRGPHAGGGV